MCGKNNIIGLFNLLSVGLTIKGRVKMAVTVFLCPWCYKKTPEDKSKILSKIEQRINEINNEVDNAIEDVEQK